MPTYPDTVITINGQRITWSRLMNNPVLLQRTLDTLLNKRLMGHRALTGRVDLTGVGVATVEQTESNLKQYPAERVAPLAQYPKTQDTPGPVASAETAKWGFEEDVPDELVSRGRGDTIARKLIKMVNQHVTQNDGRILSAIASGVTETYAAGAAWNTSGADPFDDLMHAKAEVDEKNKGFNINSFALKPTKWADLVTRAKILDRLPREGAGNVIVTGRYVQIAGLDFWSTTELPPGVSAIAWDSEMLGSIGWEDIPTQEGPAWVGSARPSAPGDDNPTAGVQVRRRPIENGVDGVTIGSRLVQVPMIQEPDAATIITGV
jgi:hypothetical protein